MWKQLKYEIIWNLTYEIIQNCVFTPQIKGGLPLKSILKQTWNEPLALWGLEGATRVSTSLKKLTCPLKRDYFNRNYIFQPLIFRGHSFVFRGIYATRLEKGMQRRLVFGSKTNDRTPKGNNKGPDSKKITCEIYWDLTISHIVLSYAHTRTIIWDWYIYLHLVVFYFKCR